MTASSLNYQTVLSVIDNCSIIALSESGLWVFALGHFKFVFKNANRSSRKRSHSKPKTAASVLKSSLTRSHNGRAHIWTWSWRLVYCVFLALPHKPHKWPYRSGVHSTGSKFMAHSVSWCTSMIRQDYLLLITGSFALQVPKCQVTQHTDAPGKNRSTVPHFKN